MYYEIPGYRITDANIRNFVSVITKILPSQGNDLETFDLGLSNLRYGTQI